jgi:hypothetical protein
LGNFTFRHIKSEFLFGYSQEELGDGQRAFVATPEKALLDLIYLTPGGDRDPYLHELRLQNLGQLNLSELNELASRSGRPKLKRAAENITILAKDSEIGWSSG